MTTTTLLRIPWDGAPTLLTTDDTAFEIHDIVEGAFEVVELRSKPDEHGHHLILGDLWMNEEYGVMAHQDQDVLPYNETATRLIKLYSPHTLMTAGRILGHCALSGPVDREGNTTSVNAGMATLIIGTHTILKGEAP